MFHTKDLNDEAKLSNSTFYKYGDKKDWTLVVETLIWYQEGTQPNSTWNTSSREEDSHVL